MLFKQRPGFTLVELSIVLVIIGVLMGMVVKGKSLIQVAQAKAEVAKIRSIINVFFFYTNDNGYKPPKYGAIVESFYSMTPLIEQGYLSSFTSLRSKVGDWHYIPRYLCEKETGYVNAGACAKGNKQGDWIGLIKDIESTEACVVSWSLLCTISNIVEDGPNMGNTGFLRTYYPTKIEDFQNCDTKRAGDTFYISMDYGIS